MTHDAETGWADALVEVLETQQSLLVQLTPLAERQGEVIEAGDTEALLRLLAERQEVIDQFLATQEGLGVLSRNLPERLSTLKPPRREHIRELVGTIDRGLARVMELDGQGRAALEAARDERTAARTHLDTARVARRAYQAAPGGAANRYADQRG